MATCRRWCLSTGFARNDEKKKQRSTTFFFVGDTKDQKKSAGPSAETCPSPPASWFELSERSECTECMFTLPTPVLEVARGLGFWLQAWVGGAKKHMGDRRAPNPLWGIGRWTPTWPEALAPARKAPWQRVLFSFPCTAKAEPF